MFTFSRAAHELWRDSINEYQCVDVSERMIDTAEYLLRGGGMSLKAVFILFYYVQGVFYILDGDLLNSALLV